MVQKLKNGEITTPEIRKLIRAHNVLVSIKIPKGAKREDIIKLITDAGYRIDHENAKLRPVAKGKVKKMKVVSQKTIAEVLPKPKTKLEKQKDKEQREEKKMQKKKEERAKRKEIVSKALSQQKKKMDREKSLKQMSNSNKKEDMPKPKQPKQTQKFKSQKEDEVRPKEKVGRPKFDPKKIKVIEQKKKDDKKVEPKQLDRYGLEVLEKKIKEAEKISGRSIENLTKQSKKKLDRIKEELENGKNTREILSVKIEKSNIKPAGQTLYYTGDKFNLIIKFGLQKGEELTRATRNRIPRATILPFEKEGEDKDKKKDEDETGIKFSFNPKIRFQNTKEVIDYVNKNFNLEKQPTKTQTEKLDKLFELIKENPKYVSGMGIGTNRGADPSPFDEGNVYIEAFYMDSGKNEAPADKRPFKYLKFKGEEKPKEKKKKK